MSDEDTMVEHYNAAIANVRRLMEPVSEELNNKVLGYYSDPNKREMTTVISLAHYHFFKGMVQLMEAQLPEELKDMEEVVAKRPTSLLN